ncbi:cadmium-translocating P-type ATPase [Candidatus Bathyarchaeota archaeon A05DMB-2]|nr:cadmium-translocating P-type ATPase [Candidatus Bathyarchaeota archaeon A05DMB-2]
MTCEEKPEQPREAEEERNKRIMILLAASLGAIILVAGLLSLLANGVPLGFAIPILNVDATISTIMYYVAVVTAATYIGVIGLKELCIERRFSVEFLMAVAALGALYLNYFFEAATVLFLYSLAEYFEGYIQDRARRTVEKLSKFMPDQARILINGSEANVNVNEVEVNSVILVKPGERIPLDGTVVEGFAYVDQALVTGESEPVLKTVNDCVFAGTVNTSGVLKIAVTKMADETLVSKIVKLVIESGKRKASIEKLVDRFAKVYVPIVIGLAVFTAAALPHITGDPFQTWLYRSLILLVVSCPSAFIISVPATVFVAITIAARRGVIIKGGIFVEKLARVKTVVFDKTGTLTLGRPIVHEVRSVEKTEKEALAYAAALDQYSNHPVAQAIVRRAAEKGIDLTKLKVTDVTEIPGKGIIGYVNGDFVAVGNPELMEEFGCDCKQAYEISEKDIHTAVCVSVGKEGMASVCVVDEVREDALRAVKSLKEIGVKTAMLTGDRVEIAKETAQALKIDEVHAELFPEDKLRLVEGMKGKDGLVVMVGDGVNDAPALAASDVGIAMGSAGVDVALESADVVLVRDELAQVPYLVKLSGKTMGIAKQNIAASLVVKLILGALGLMGLTPLWFTVASGDDGVTMLLLLNTLRLQKVK